MNRKRKKSSKEHIKSMFRELVCDIYRHALISRINALAYMKMIDKI